MNSYKNKNTSSHLSRLISDCSKCFGLCCTALYFSAAEGFPRNKAAGKPCSNLLQDFRCAVHDKLEDRGYKGCISYDCFGAGQKVSEIIYGGHSWRETPESSKEMFEVFIAVRQLHEILWYLTQATELQTSQPISKKLTQMISSIKGLINSSPADILKLDIQTSRSEAALLLSQASELYRETLPQNKEFKLANRKNILQGADYMGKDLRKTNLIGSNLKGAFLIASDLRSTDLNGADLLGADFRDANLKGADLRYALFLTPGQIASAKIDSTTKLPAWYR